MTTVTRVIPPLPNAEIPIVDPDTGKVSVAWYLWFVNIIAVLNEIRSKV